jgi:hypothetical protein
MIWLHDVTWRGVMAAYTMTGNWVWTRSTSSFQRSNWSPTYILHLFHLEDTSLLFIFSLNPSKSAFFHALTLSLLPKNHMLFIVSKQCTCSRRVHINLPVQSPLFKEICYGSTRKRWPFNTPDCLIEVTAWAGLT